MENLEKSWNLKKVFPGPEKSWKTRKMPKVMEKAWKMKILCQIINGNLNSTVLVSTTTFTNLRKILPFSGKKRSWNSLDFPWKSHGI